MPWRAAPKAALSSPLTMIVAAVTALLACFLGTAAVLQASAAGGATAQYQARLACPDTYGPTFSKTGAAVASTPAEIAAVERHAAAHGFGRPVVATYTPVIRGTEFNGANHYRIRLAYRGDQTLPACDEMTFEGADTGRLRHSERRVLRRDHLGLVFQNPTDNLLGYLTVADNLRAAAESARTTCHPEGILGQLDLSGTGAWHISALSGGQQQRLAFGCALARGSTVVVADEPTSQLDEASADLMLDTLRYLAAQEYTVVVASHDDRLIGLGSRVAWLRKGTLEKMEYRGGELS
jgi:putative ABC transport system ATP-binding protein